MVDFDSNSAECSVFTFKEGLLSAVAHDLKLAVGRFTVRAGRDGGPSWAVSGRWDAGSLTVKSVMKDGHELAGALGARDFDKIAKTVREEVLQSGRYPEIVFASTAVALDGDRARITGDLTVCGRKKSITFEARQSSGRWVAEVVLHQPDFGIKPYSAMLGALKIKPDVKVRVSLPADRLSLGAEGGA